MKPHEPHLIGQAPSFLKVLDLIRRMARFDAPVLIEGETGTGKEQAARAIHYGSRRAYGPFVAINCGALPEALIESELFGAERGAYTDARSARAGMIQSAEGGTLFLDELDALPARAQVALLRFLQDQSYRPVGGARDLKGDVRIVAAASPRLRLLLHSGGFRDDLAFRLDVLRIQMPPLRERPGDCRLLVEHFVQRHCLRLGLDCPRLHPACISLLDAHAWPGNVRELDNLVQRSLLLSEGELLHLDPRQHVHLPEPVALEPERCRTDPNLSPFNQARDEALSQFERDYLTQLMQLCQGNVSRAARMSGKERRCLGKLLKKYGLGHASPLNR
ncbi:MAG: hypothetical protein RJA44_2474 [Pseudomonadota bacterium]